VRALGLLKAKDALMKRWYTQPGEISYSPYCRSRHFLLETLTSLMTYEESAAFLIKAHRAETETGYVRFHALLALCAGGDPNGLEYVKSVWERDQKMYPARMRHEPRGIKPSHDRDGDKLTDYVEQGLLLDPDKPDTDDDGVPDGVDRNPLTAPAKELTESQQIARVVFWAYTKLVDDPKRNLRRTIAPHEWIYLTPRTNRYWDNSDTPSLTSSIEFAGINGFVLCLDTEQIEEYRAMRGRTRTRTVLIMCIDELEDARMRDIMMREVQLGEGEKLFFVAEGTHGNARDWRVTVRKYGDLWLPVAWRLGGCT